MSGRHTSTTVKISRGRKHAAIDVEFAAVVVAGDVAAASSCAAESMQPTTGMMHSDALWTVAFGSKFSAVGLVQPDTSYMQEPLSTFERLL